ncbi:hypothetical protein Hanom_Chr03g00267201 [Helianthus anomalus]
MIPRSLASVSRSGHNMLIVHRVPIQDNGVKVPVESLFPKTHHLLDPYKYPALKIFFRFSSDLSASFFFIVTCNFIYSLFISLFLPLLNSISL